MNKIRGSVIAKMMVWFVLVFSAVFFIGSCMAVGVMGDYSVFQQTKEETLENRFSVITDCYSTRALANFRDGLLEENETYFADKAFRYGIIEAESLDGIDLNNENSYLIRNFDNKVGQDELQAVSFYLSENSQVRYSDDLFGEYGYFTDVILEEVLYADRICYDKVEGIFYYRAEGKYYPIQSVELMISREIEDDTYVIEDFDFVFDNDRRKYKNLRANEYSTEPSYENHDMELSEVVEMPMQEEIWISEGEKVVYMEQPIIELGSEELSILFREEELTFNQFDGTELDFTKLGSIIFDGVRQLNASEITIINSKTIPQSGFVEVEYAYLDEYYTLHVQAKNAIKHYMVVSYVDKAVLEAEKRAFLSKIGSDSWAVKLEAVVSANDIDSYVRMAVFIDILYEMREGIISMVFGTFLLTVICFVFLICAAGHRRKKEEIVPTFIDQIPLDVLCVVVFFIEGVAACILFEVRHLDSVVIVIQLFVGIGVIMACLAMMALLSFVVRIKMGKWWRNSVIYWIATKFRIVFVRIWYGCGVLWKNISILWKVMTVQFIISLLVILVGCFFGTAEYFAIAMLITNIIVCPGFLWIVLQFRKIQRGSRMIAEGNLNHKIETTKMFWEFKKLADNLNRISEGMSHAVDERMKSERFKTELITNVSHDIKTPLTSIINYVDLLGKTDIQDKTAKEYLEVLERQSARLKKLIEDLIEASKASTGNLSVSMEELEANVFVTQILGEFEEKVANAGLELIIHKPEEEIPVYADGRHLWRIVDNLMNNVCKYAQSGSRVYINLEQKQDKILLTFRNMSKYPLNITSEELMERFVRGDSSRNTEGNGLGLSIAKSLMELMNGELLLYVDGDLFKVVLSFPR